MSFAGNHTYLCFPEVVFIILNILYIIYAKNVLSCKFYKMYFYVFDVMSRCCFATIHNTIRITCGSVYVTTTYAFCQTASFTYFVS